MSETWESGRGKGGDCDGDPETAIEGNRHSGEECDVGML